MLSFCAVRGRRCERPPPCPRRAPERAPEESGMLVRFVAVAVWLFVYPAPASRRLNVEKPSAEASDRRQGSSQHSSAQSNADHRRTLLLLPLDRPTGSSSRRCFLLIDYRLLVVQPDGRFVVHVQTRRFGFRHFKGNARSAQPAASSKKSSPFGRLVVTAAKVHLGRRQFLRAVNALRLGRARRREAPASGGRTTVRAAPRETWPRRRGPPQTNQ